MGRRAQEQRRVEFMVQRMPGARHYDEIRRRFAGHAGGGEVKARNLPAISGTCHNANAHWSPLAVAAITRCA
jgi:hypothetical protein